MSKHSGSRRPSPSAKAQTGSRKGVPTKSANGRGRVGERDFTRRARAVSRGLATPRARAQRTSRMQLHQRSPLLSLTGLFGRIPRVALLCGLVACLNAACWSIVTPPFQGPDEPDHFAYVKQLVEQGSLPSGKSQETSSVEELQTLTAIHYYQVRQQPQHHTISSRSEQRTLEETLANVFSRGGGSVEAGVATSQPPLYYALEAVPYSVAGGNVLDRLQLMRLLSAIFAGLTAMFVYLFVREALPGAPWAWTVGGLAVALVPLLGFTSGIVNPDSLLFAVSAAVFYALARSFRLGLNTHRAVMLGGLTAIGTLTKLNFIGLLPGVVLGICVLSARARRTHGRSALRMLVLALGISFCPVAVYAVANALSGHPTLGIVSNALNTTHGSILAQIDYIWQLYLPRLPGTTNYFPGLFTTRQFWFDGYVGLYGWFDTTFPGWVYSLALIPAFMLVLLGARGVARSRAPLPSRLPELLVYTVMGIGLLALVGADSYRLFPETNAGYAQTRYLLPLLPLLGAGIALAARGAGRRWGPVVGSMIVILFLAHDIFSQMLVAGRFYG